MLCNTQNNDTILKMRDDTKVAATKCRATTNMFSWKVK